MADVESGGDSGGGHGKHQKRRAKKSSTRIDMTPMVDLAFLLLTFFVLTSTFSKPSEMDIGMPPKTPAPPTNVKNIVTIVLDKSDTVYYYYGVMDTAKAAPYLLTNYSKDGLRKVLINYNRGTGEGQQPGTYDAYDKIMEAEKRLKSDTKLKDKEREDAFKKEVSKITDEKTALTVVVKTLDGAKYGRVIDVMDELSVCYIDRKALVDITNTEKVLLDRQKTLK
jgi:biopolymer transport protein ExbD